MSRRLTGFGPVVVLGLVAAALLAVAATKVWVSHALTIGGRPAGVDLVGSDIGKEPLAAALAYVLLAGWGVLLVTRGVVRRAAAVLLALVSLGLLVVVVVAALHLPDDVRAVFDAQTRAGARLSAGFTGWYWVAAVAAAVSLAATTVAVREARTWPAMGRRYDAPGSAGAAAAHESAVARPDADADDPEAGNLALWRSIDQGHDPTDPTDPTDTRDPRDSSHPDEPEARA